MIKFISFAAYKKAENSNFKKRAKYALKTKSLACAAKLANDFLKTHFAKYLIVDASGTKQFAWTLKGAYAWLPFCAPENAKIVDTLDFSVVAERSHYYI